MFDKLEDLVKRLDEVMQELSEPDVVSDQNRFRNLMKEQNELAPIVEKYKEYKEAKQTIEDSVEMLEEEHDEEMRELLKEELSAKDFKKAKKRVLIHHIPLYGNDGKNLCADLWTKLLEKAPFNVSLNAHTHTYAYHPKGELGNNYPVIIGGGYKMDSATVMILEKKKEVLRIKVLNTKGETLLDITV